MIRLICCLFLLLFLASCRTIPQSAGYDVNKHELSKGDPRLRAAGEEILQSIRDLDYARFSRYFNGYGEEITEEHFKRSGKQIFDQFGNICGYEYLADLELPLLHHLIWKVAFEREGSQQQKIRQELLFRLVMGTEKGVPKIISMGFL